jgi:hypothetical protein
VESITGSDHDRKYGVVGVLTEGQRLLDELAMVFVEAAVRRLLKEQALRDSVQPSEII